MNGRRRDGAACGLLVAAAFVFYGPLFAPGAARRWFEAGDFTDQFFAFAHFEVASLAAGRLPLWNPFAYAGTPFWADVQAAVAYPPSLAVALAAALARGTLPFLWLEAEAVLHVGLAAALTYLFAARVLGSRSGAAVAAVAFGFGGFVTGYPPLQLAVLETCVWLPLALLGVERWIERAACAPDARVPLDPVLPLALALAILAGHPQSANYVLYTTAAWFLWRARPWRRNGRSRRRLLGFTGSALLGLGLSAAGWLPALEYMRLSNRAAADYAALANGFPPRELLGLVLPGLTKWSPLYVGVLPLLLALSAAWWALTAAGEADGDEAADPRGKPAFDDGPTPAPSIGATNRFFVMLSVVALLLSLGRHAFVFDLFYLVAPGFDLFRGQERAAFLVSFGLAMLAGAGTALWLAGERAIGRGVARGAAGLAAVAIVVAVAGPSTPAAVRLVLLVAAAAVVAATTGSGRLRGRALAAVVVALAAADLYLANSGANLATTPPAELSPGPIVAGLRLGGVQRVADEHRLPPNFGVLHGVESTGGASPLRPRTFQALVGALEPEHAPRLWQLLAVSHVVTWRDALDVPAEGLASQGEGDDLALLYQLEQAVPYVWRVAAVEPVADDASALARLAAADFDPLSTALIHAELGAVLAHPGGSAGGIGDLVRAPGEVTFETRGDAAGWVVVSEIHYPGWRAEIDGRPAPLYRADVALMALEVPAGAHSVRLRFTAPRVIAGILLSFASVAGLGIVWAGIRRDAPVLPA